VITTRDIKFHRKLDSDCANTEEIILKDFIEEDRADTNTKTPGNIVEAEAALNAIQEPNVEMRRAPGRPRILRTGSRGRPRKEFRFTSSGNTANENTGQNGDSIDESTIEISDSDTLSNDNEADVEDDVFHEANLAIASAKVAEVQLQEAMTGPQANEWLDAIVTEFKNILAQDTWELVERPMDRTVIGCRLILTTKLGPDGMLSRRKARLVARGFLQRPGIDFMQTYAPVARLESMRLMMALAVRYKMKIHQLDIVTAYLNGFLNEEVFMEKPKMLKKILLEIVQRDGEHSILGAKAVKMLHDIQDENRVCLLKKALYGLRQAGRQWHARLDTVIRKLGLTPINADPCLYILRRGETKLIVLIYVDDILICSQDKTKIKRFCHSLAREFEVKELGLARYCLGIEINRKEDIISLTQQKYTQEILERFHMESCNPVSTPGETRARAMDTIKTQTNKDDENLTMPYRELVGALMYLAVATRPDIAYIASYLAQFNNCYTPEQWGMAKRTLRYLQGTSNFGLCFRKTNDKIAGYSDADWGNCAIDRRSYTGYSFILSGAAVSWKVQKQRTIALSSTKAEYMALA